MTDKINIQVVYALPERQEVINVRLPKGATLQQAVEASEILSLHPEIDLAASKVGIFGKLSKLDTILREHDRVEIYRALIADPKEVRKQRAAEGKPMKKGAGASE